MKSVAILLRLGWFDIRLRVGPLSVDWRWYWDTWMWGTDWTIGGPHLELGPLSFYFAMPGPVLCRK